MCQKLGGLKLLDSKVHHSEIARKFEFSERTIPSIAERHLEQAHPDGCNDTAKSNEASLYPEVSECAARTVILYKRCGTVVQYSSRYNT